MSTKSTVLFSAPASTALPEDLSSGLCHALLPAGIGSGVVLKHLPDRQLMISIRPFCIATDMSILYSWMSREYAGPLLAHAQPPRELEESYACMLGADFVQPFMGMVNDMPVCQVDICKAQQDVISLYYHAHPGDYGIRLVLAPLTVQDNIMLLISAYLEYFFSFPEVGRIVADIGTGDEWNSRLFTSAGFRIAQKVRGPRRDSTLYICTRSSFRQPATH